MSKRDKNITISILFEETLYEIQTYQNEYGSLMMLLFDRISPEGFGDCLGMGKCGTCLIKIMESPHDLSYNDRNEQTTLYRAGIDSKNVRLACQIQIDEQLDGLKISIL